MVSFRIESLSIKIRASSWLYIYCGEGSAQVAAIVYGPGAPYRSESVHRLDGCARLAGPGAHVNGNLCRWRTYLSYAN